MPDEQDLNNQQQDDQVSVPDDSIDQLKIDLDAATQEAEKNLRGWQVAQASLENFKKEQEKKNAELVEFAREVAVAKLLPSLDSLHQALLHAPTLTPTPLPKGEGFLPPLGEGGQRPDEGFSKQYQTWLSGIGGLIKQLDKALLELGVEKIEALGKKFDPHVHEAIREIESDQAEGTIVEEYMTGYKINGKVVRPSQVAISKKEQ